jgi:hypothetical protein
MSDLPRLIKEIDDQFRSLFRFLHDHTVAGAGDDFWTTVSDLPRLINFLME